MQYLGKISGHGMLQRMGRHIADTDYEIEGFRQNPGMVKASGQLSLSCDLTENLTGIANMQLLTDAGELLEIKRPNADRPPGRYFDFEVTGNLDAIGDWKR
jgi:hypothetical protein